MGDIIRFVGLLQALNRKQQKLNTNQLSCPKSYSFHLYGSLLRSSSIPFLLVENWHFWDLISLLRPLPLVILCMAGSQTVIDCFTDKETKLMELGIIARGVKCTL